MKTLKVILLLLAFTVSGLVAARAPEVIVNYPAVAVQATSGKELSADQVKAIVRTVAEGKKWVLVEQPDGKLLGRLSWNNDRHTIMVDIACSAGSYSINYKDSINMRYMIWNDQPVIHPYYNRFVRELNDAIRFEAMKL